MYCLNKNLTTSKQSKSLLPSKIKCIGCRLYFIQQEILPLENLHVQFKNYRDLFNLQAKHRQIILRTVIAFLNAKGGVIFMGVEDQKCSVVGNPTIKNKQEDFRRFIFELCENVYPIVHKKDNKIRIEFVPVMKRNGLFTGKYVTKIIVQQGRTDIVYTMGVALQQLKCIQDDNKLTNYNLRVGYVRLGVGGNSKLEDIHLFDEIYRRTKDPNDTCKFHEGCHPIPKQGGNLQIKVLGFKVQKSKTQPLASFIAKTYFNLKIPVKNTKEEYVGLKRLYTIEFNSFDEAERVLESYISQQNENSMSSMNPIPEELRYDLQGIEDGVYLFIPSVKISNKQKQVKINFKRVQEQSRIRSSRVQIDNWGSDDDEDYERHRRDMEYNEREQSEGDERYQQIQNRRKEQKGTKSNQTNVANKSKYTQIRKQQYRRKQDNRQQNKRSMYQETNERNERNRPIKQEYKSKPNTHNSSYRQQQDRRQVRRQQYQQIEQKKITKTKIIIREEVPHESTNRIKQKPKPQHQPQIKLAPPISPPSQPSKTKIKQTYRQVPKQQTTPKIVLSSQKASQLRYYQFTHISRGKVGDLSSFLRSLFSFQCNYYEYQQSLLFEMTPNQINQIRIITKSKRKQLQQFGYNNWLIHGIANGHIFVQDFKQQKVDSLMEDIRFKFLDDKLIKTLKVMEQKNYIYIDIRMEERNAAQALDILLQRKQLYKYSKHSERNKIKFLLQHQ